MHWEVIDNATDRVRLRAGRAALRVLRDVHRRPMPYIAAGLAGGFILGLFPSARRQTTRTLKWLLRL